VLPKKFLDDAPCDDPRAPLSDREVHARLVAAVLDDERSVAAAYRDRSQSAASAAGFSIATTASPSAGIPLRGAFIRFRPGFKNSLRGKLYQLCGAGDIFIAINSWRLGPFWSAEMAHSFAATDTEPP